MDIVGKRRWFFLFSGIVILAGIISMAIPPSLKPGIDFTSGSVLTITFSEAVSESDVRTQLNSLGHSDAIIQKLGKDTVLIRTKVLKEPEIGADGKVIKSSDRDIIEKVLEANVASIQGRQFDTTSPIVAAETVRNATIAVIVAALGILLYVTWAFRAIPHSFRYGAAAIIALVHDLLIVVGIFSILGKVIGLEINAMFIVGLLTVLGYSVNDTIVVFDRIRENVIRSIDQPIEQTINDSILQSIGRSINTSFTTIVVLVALLIMGGPTIQGLLLALLIGVASGTYSSIAIASQFLIVWERGEIRKFLRILRLSPARN